MKKRAFSLAELVISAGIMGLLVFGAASSLSKSQATGGSSGLAMYMADVFRDARQLAMTHQYPVAVMLPSGGGALAHSDSYYLLAGETLPKVTKSRTFRGEYPSTFLYAGRWPLTGASAGTLTTTVSVPGGKYSSFVPNTWLPPANLNDLAFIFLPDGSVRTNGLANFDGKYHVGVVAGLTYSGGGPTANLTSAGQSQTIAISPLGHVEIEGSLTSSTGVAGQGRMGGAATAAPPSVTPAVAPASPVMLGAPVISPPQDPLNLPNGIDATLTKDQFLTLQATAKSPSGHPLYCKWQLATPVPPAGPGSYSFQGNGGRMTWDPKLDGGNGAWTTTWQWRPPPGAVPADVYRLQCVVQNEDGGWL